MLRTRERGAIHRSNVQELRHRAGALPRRTARPPRRSTHVGAPLAGEMARLPDGQGMAGAGPGRQGECKVAGIADSSFLRGTPSPLAR